MKLYLGRKSNGCRIVTSFVVLMLANCLLSKASLARVKITIGYAAVAPRTIPLWIAQEEGFFKKYGIEARFVVFRGAPTLVASLVSGHINLGLTSGGTVLNSELTSLKEL